jgi:glycosyltransferase involved in cell wall biosynthesis
MKDQTGMDAAYPKITIVTPSYNQEAFLEYTILSVIHQNYPNLEYIVIDGGSTDRSVEIIKKYEKYISYWVSEPDNGQTHAINKGFKLATGDVVNWLNSSYMLKLGALENIAEAVRANRDADVYYGDYLAVDSQGYILYQRKMGPYRPGTLFWGRQLSCQPSVFFKRNLLEKHGYLDESKTFCMDTEFWIRISKAGAVFQQIKHPIGVTRSHVNAKTTRLQPVLHAEHKEIVRLHHGLDSFSAGSWAENAYFSMMNRLFRMGAAVNRMVFRGDLSFGQATFARQSLSKGE